MKFIVLSLALLFAGGCVTKAERKIITCDGVYDQHLQGVDANDKNEYFWSFTNVLVKTDDTGKILKKVEVPHHHGDLVAADDGLLYVASGVIKDYSYGAISATVYIYDQKDLSLVREIPMADKRVTGGIVKTPNGFAIGESPLPLTNTESYIVEYDNDFNEIGRHLINTPSLPYAVQVLTNLGDGYLGGYYGYVLYRFDKDFNVVGRYRMDAAIGLVDADDEGFLRAVHTVNKRPNYAAQLEPVQWKDVPIWNDKAK